MHTEGVRLPEAAKARLVAQIRLLSRNVHPKYVQELLGHASIALALDTYPYILPGMGGGTAIAMEDALPE